MKALTASLLILISTLPGFSAPRDAQWDQVAMHLAKDLPKSAIEVLTTIDIQARAENAWPEAVRATAQRVMLEGRIAEGRDAIGRVTGLDPELAKAPPEMKPLLQTLQALWLWDYFYQNRWQFMQRTQTAAKPSDDIQTWDLKRILAEIDTRLLRALENRAALQQCPIANYDFLIIKGSAADELRPTLYDFLAHQILAFYAAEEQVNAAAEDSFTFGKDTPAFGTVAEFIAWKPASSDEKSWKLKTIRLYQELLAFHQQDMPARTHLDLLRLNWAKGALTGADADKRLEERLNEIITATAGHELQSLARANLANLHIAQKRMTEARAIAISGSEAFPDSPFAKMCVAAREAVERKECDVSTELIWNAAKPQFDVHYRNISKLHFRLYQRTWEPEGSNRDEKYLKKLLAREPAKQWSTELEPTPDFLAKSKALDAALDVPKGYYELITSVNPDFATSGNCLGHANVWVSELALTKVTMAANQGFVNHALTGAPIQNAKVELWDRDNNRDKWNLAETVSTDANGCYTGKNRTKDYLPRVIHQGDALAGQQGWVYGNTDSRNHDWVFLFTDRALYRPGQTIRFKGIAAFYDRTANDYHTKNNQDLEVMFMDLNQKEIAKLKVKS
ncbi:MAG: hypothetical protein RLZZ522_1282, partial [Verrucomicrobiota bacterium]